MASNHTLGGASRPGRVIGPALDKIIKNAAWRKHAALVAACKSALDRLDSLSDSPDPDPSSPLLSLSPADADLVLHPLVLALDAASPKVAEPALDCVHKLLSLSLLRGDIADPSPSASTAGAASSSRLLAAVCACSGLGDDALELAMLRVLLAAVRSHALFVRGEGLVQIVKSCYNVYLGSHSAANQVCAKVVLAQIVTIVFTRVEADTIPVAVPTVSIADMLDLSDKSLNDSSIVQAAQKFINDAMEGSEAEAPPLSIAPPADGEPNGTDDSGGLSKIREDGLFLFKNLCKLSMKFSTAGEPEDHLLLRGKVLSLELLRMVIDSSGPVWRTSERHVMFFILFTSS